MIKKWIVLLVFLSGLQVSFAQTEQISKDIQTFTLEEAQAYAIENSYSTQSYKLIDGIIRQN